MFFYFKKKYNNWWLGFIKWYNRLYARYVPWFWTVAKQCRTSVTTLKSLSHPDRLMLLCQFVDGEACVSELEQATGIAQPSLSQQLGILWDKQLVATCRRGDKFIIASTATCTGGHASAVWAILSAKYAWLIFSLQVFISAAPKAVNIKQEDTADWFWYNSIHASFSLDCRRFNRAGGSSWFFKCAYFGMSGIA